MVEPAPDWLCQPTPTGTPADGIGLTGSYYTDGNFTNLAYTQTDPAVNFAWGAGSPSGLPANSFSVKWTGSVQALHTETVTFCVSRSKNDMVRLWVNGQLLVNVWTYNDGGEACGPAPPVHGAPVISPAREWAGTIALAAGTRYTIELRFVDLVDDASVGLSWYSPTHFKEIIPSSQLFPENQPATPTPTPTPTKTPTKTSTPAHTPTPTLNAPSGQVWKYYYHAGAQRVAMRVTGSPDPQGNGLFYTLGDNLGSTSLVTDAGGNKVSEMRYEPWGETRYANGITPTDYRYTGQREEAGIGLYYYNARWYDAELGRFAQADTVLPSLLNPQSFDRYAYVYNNSLKMVDPSGNIPLECEFEAEGGRCGGRSLNDPIPEHGRQSNKPMDPRRKAVEWVKKNAEGNNCAEGEDNDCACIVAQAINASGGHTTIDPDTMAYIRTDDLMQAILDQGGERKGYHKLEVNQESGYPYQGDLSQRQSWEAVEQQWIKEGIRPGDIIFYSDYAHGGYEGHSTHASMVVRIDYDPDGTGHIIIRDQYGERPIDDQILGDCQIGEVWWVRPNY